MRLSAATEPMNVTIEMPKELSAVVLHFKREDEPSGAGAAMGSAEYDSWCAGLLEYQSWGG